MTETTVTRKNVELGCRQTKKFEELFLDLKNKPFLGKSKLTKTNDISILCSNQAKTNDAIIEPELLAEVWDKNIHVSYYCGKRHFKN